jgi:putative oxidoreductase
VSNSVQKTGVFVADLFQADLFQRWSVLPLRLIVGFGFVAHGYAKLLRGPENFAGILQAMHVPAPMLAAWMTIIVEIAGGAAVLLGAFVALASIPMAAVLLSAMFTVHLRYGFSSIKLQAITPTGAQFGPPGYELDLLYLACLATLVTAGAGPWSIDEWIKRVRSNRRGNIEKDLAVEAGSPVAVGSVKSASRNK